MENTLMKITDSGKKLVESVPFALQIRECLAQLTGKESSEEHGNATAVSLIAWAASGHDLNQPPKGHEVIDLAHFIYSNVPEINALVNKCLENLVEYDTNGTVN
jgi:hypothetical protein